MLLARTTSDGGDAAADALSDASSLATTDFAAHRCNVLCIVGSTFRSYSQGVAALAVCLQRFLLVDLRTECAGGAHEVPSELPFFFILTMESSWLRPDQIIADLRLIAAPHFIMIVDAQKSFISGAIAYNITSCFYFPRMFHNGIARHTGNSPRDEAQGTCLTVSQQQWLMLWDRIKPSAL